MTEEVLRFHQVSLSQKEEGGLLEASFTLFRRERMCLYSPHSEMDLARACAGVDSLAAGEIFFCGSKIDSQDSDLVDKLWRRIGIIDKNSTLISDFTIWENIILDPTFHSRQLSSEQKIMVLKFAEALGIDQKLDAYPIEVSAGVKRAAIYVREAIRVPQLMVIENPSNDLGLVRLPGLIQVMEFFKDHHSTAWLILTSDKEFISQTADRVLLVKQGRILEEVGGDGFLAYINQSNSP